MPADIKEADWKVLRRAHPLALERFCERVLAEVAHVSGDRARSYHDRYLQIYKIMEQRERELAQLFDNPRRSQGLRMLAHIRAEGLLTDEEFSRLSPETRDAIGILLGAG
ncbi:MAG: peptide ABC transporter substrate-binding protein [Deltaproteobacteria bacterium]|nr:peptide ABC transporter substrate-binding protein [Deltaproteobacteria bacterium]